MRNRSLFLSYAFLLGLDLFIMNLWGALTGVAPGGDTRAHIFRITYFIQGMVNGDYTTIQYHGYSFLSGYGYFLYAAATPFYLFLSALLHSQIEGVILVWNMLYVLTPFLLAAAAISLASELRPSLSISMRILLGASILFFIPTIYAIDTGALPSAWSLAFSLIAAKYGLRNSKFGFISFSVLALYTETFAYLYVPIVCLLLLSTGGKRKFIAQCLPVIIGITCFSWVQLIDSVHYMSPLIDLNPDIFGIRFYSFNWIFITFSIAFVPFFLYAVSRLFPYKRKKGKTILVVGGLGTFSFLLAAAALLRGDGIMSFGALNSIIDGLIPWRFLYLGFSACAFIGAFILIDKSPSKLMRVIAFEFLAFLIIVDLVFGAAPLQGYASYPSTSSLSSLNGSNVLVPEHLLSEPTSPVSFSNLYNFSTVNGAYSQGDPSFYYLTSYYEWMNAFLNASSYSAYNLMQLSGAREVILPNGTGDPAQLKAQSFYDKGFRTYSASPSPSLADEVTPIYLAAANQTEALLFSLYVNILGASGYRLTFTTQSNIQNYGVVVLPGGKLSTVGGGKMTMIINDTSFLSHAKKIFPYVPYLTNAYPLEENISSLAIFEANSLCQTLLSFFHPIYEPLQISVGSNSYTVTGNSSGLPILIKASYYPYFHGTNYSYDIYHLILIDNPPNGEAVRLVWDMPFYAGSLEISIITGPIAVVVYFFGRRRAAAK